MTIARMLVLLLTLGILGGCAASGPPFAAVTEIPDGSALVYIYRPNQFVGGGVSYTVHAGEKSVVKLTRGGYYPLIVPAGETEFWAKTEARASVTELLKAGGTYYLKGGIGVGFLMGRPKLNFVDAATGQNEVASCKLLGASF